MKLEDIKNAIKNAAIADFRRACYNLASCSSEEEIRSLFEAEITGIYDFDLPDCSD